MAFRQGVECGFQGRTNKLVDGCYSFWQVIFFLTFSVHLKFLNWTNKLIFLQGGVLVLMQRLLSIVDKQLKTTSVSRSHPTELTGDRSGLDDNLCQTEMSHQVEGTSNSMGKEVIF